MAKQLVLALLCAAVAVAAARELSQAKITVSELPKQLQELNSRLAALAGKKSDKQVSAASILETEDYEPASKKYSKYGDDYEKPSSKYESKYEDKYEKKYEDKYEKKSSYGYAKEKVSVKLFEKFRSHLRPQPGNVNTFQFTSELTCQNPKSEHGPEHEDGFIGFPIVSDRMKLVTVGVCEWTVTQVKEQRISEHAKLKGNTNVVCTFTEEAERHCKGGQDILEEGLTVSGQGLVYNFESAQYGSYKTEAMADTKDEEAEGVDVYLNLINGVINREKEMKYDNGALQYFFGVPPTSFDKGRDATFSSAEKKGDPTGEYTFVFKN